MWALSQCRVWPDDPRSFSFSWLTPVLKKSKTEKANTYFQAEILDTLYFYMIKIALFNELQSTSSLLKRSYGPYLQV